MKYVFVALFLLTSALFCDASCDLTGAAWPVTNWQDIMRGTTLRVCDTLSVGNGYCDNTNNFASSSCSLDGGDCCMNTCYANCVGKQAAAHVVITVSTDIPYANPPGLVGQCAHMCGVRTSTDSANCPYMCVDDSYVSAGSSYTGWCSGVRGSQTAMGSCYSTLADVVDLLIECVLDERSHGNINTASLRCGNQTGDCTFSDVVSQTDGCDLHPSSCTKGSCCSTAFTRGWIDPVTTVLPTDCEVYATCSADPECFSTMAQCARTNKACQGGCCKCTSREWFGHNCDNPLCWPRCRNGNCVAPNTCFCEPGWSGESCEIPVCSPNCAAGQGVCVAPNVCECFYGWTGEQCELAKSTPECVNGIAVAPDVCRCNPGWGGRICDYPICQSYPDPSAECGNGVCDAPWTCKCDPGWSLTIPADENGLPIPPTFWKGRDVTVNVSATAVFGDTRFVATTQESLQDTLAAVTTYVFNEFNAYQCLTPTDCRVIVDGHCSACTSTSPSVCTACDTGFFLHPSTARCLRCNEEWSRCRTCDPTQCLVCDPLFALVNAECVSDGIFEFSSPVYNARADAGFVTITVIRTKASVAEPSSSQSREVSLVVQTDSPRTGKSACFGSTTKLADYETTKVLLTFSAGQTFAQVNIPVYDNLVFDPEPIAFSVRLIPDPSIVSGSTQPIRPTTASVHHDPIAEAKIFIWDTSLFDYTTCSINATALPPITFGSPTFSIPIACLVCSTVSPENGSCITWSPMSSTTATLFLSTPIVASSDLASITPTSLLPTLSRSTTAPYNTDGHMLLTVSLPAPIVSSTAVSFSVSIQALSSGVLAQHYIFTENPAPDVPADVTRKEHKVNITWDMRNDATSLLLYTGFIHFACISSAVGAVPESIGVAISEGATVNVTLFGEKVISNVRTLFPEDTGEIWQAPLRVEELECADINGIYCYDITSKSIGFSDVIPFEIRFSPSPLSYQRPVGLRLLMRNIEDSSVNATPLWRIVPETCLYAGVEIPGSPVRGLVTPIAGPR